MDAAGRGVAPGATCAVAVATLSCTKTVRRIRTTSWSLQCNDSPSVSHLRSGQCLAGLLVVFGGFRLRERSKEIWRRSLRRARREERCRGDAERADAVVQKLREAEAERHLEDFLESTLLPEVRRSKATLPQVLRKLSEQKQANLLYATLKTILEDGSIKLQESNCTVGISTCARAKMWQQGLKLFEAMTKAKVQRKVFSYNAAISACEKGRQWPQALKLFEAMPEMKVQPDVISYNAAISACEKGGQWPQALKLFEAMPEVEVQPDLVTYNALFDCSEFQSSALGRALFLQSKLPEFQELRGCDASKIDLHDLSEGTARLVLCHWLSTAVATKLEQEKDLNCLIVTGRGRSRKEWDTTDVRQASLELLQDLGLQAGLLPKNPGRIRVRLRKADLPALRSAGASFNR